MRYKSLIKSVLLLLLLADLGYTFLQHYGQPLYGDLAEIVLPSPHYQQVLESPFGIDAIINGKSYAGTNRYFIHQALSLTFLHCPEWLQSFFSPIESLYVLCALLKTAIHTGLIFVICMYVTGHRRVWTLPFLASALLASAFFQVNGFVHVIGIVDRSVVYSFFYALPLLGLLVFFFPFFQSFRKGIPLKQVLNPFRWAFLIALMVMLAFSGPLISPIVLIVCPGVLVAALFKYCLDDSQSQASSILQALPGAFRELSVELGFFFGGFSLLALYSFYLGTHNLENDLAMSLWERYSRLPQGLIHLATIKIAIPLMVATLGLNFFLTKRYFPEKISAHHRWTAIGFLLFAGVYLLLLPFGGYRSYRPDIVRYDTLLPITLLLVASIGYSSYFVFRSLPRRPANFYALLIVGVAFVFSSVDLPGFDHSACEKESLRTLATAQKETVPLESGCPVLAWETFQHPKRSRFAGEMLFLWNVTDEKRLFYHK